MSNPASEYCVQQGGTVSIEKQGDGAEYGVCVFEDNRQCEEWALMRGECPVGGVKVTGYVTAAARYCAITGGEYTMTGQSGTEKEEGTCTLKDGQECDVWQYYNGDCRASAPMDSPLPTPGSTGAGWQPLSADSCAALAQAASQGLGMDMMRDQAPFSDPVGGEVGTGCQATATGTGQDFASPQAAVDALTAVLKGQGWQADPQLAAGGPTGMASGFRQEDLVFLASANWRPSPEADCPEDEPIVNCKLAPAQQLYTVTLNCAQGGGN